MILAKRKLAIKSLYVSMAMIAVAILTFTIKPLMILAGIIGAGAFGYYLYLSFTYWKCPACNNQFPVVYSRMDERTECWYCLASLEDPIETPTENPQNKEAADTPN